MTLRATVYRSGAARSEKITAEVHSVLKVQHTARDTSNKCRVFVQWQVIVSLLRVQEVWIGPKMSSEKSSETVGCNASIMKNVWEIRGREHSQKLDKEQERMEKSALET